MEIRRQAKRKKDSATTIKCSFLSMDLLEDEILSSSGFVVLALACMARCCYSLALREAAVAAQVASFWGCSTFLCLPCDAALALPASMRMAPAHAISCKLFHAPPPTRKPARFLVLPMPAHAAGCPLEGCPAARQHSRGVPLFRHLCQRLFRRQRPARGVTWAGHQHQHQACCALPPRGAPCTRPLRSRPRGIPLRAHWPACIPKQTSHAQQHMYRHAEAQMVSITQLHACGECLLDAT